MQHGDPGEKHCARCGQVLGTNMMYHDGLFWHQACVQHGSRQLANAERIARSLNPALFVNAQSLSEMIRYAEAITPPIFFYPTNDIL